MLWEVDTGTYNPIVATAMRYNRFETLKKYAHCADNDNFTPDDKFAKVRPIFRTLNDTVLKYASLNGRISIDESMIPTFN